MRFLIHGNIHPAALAALARHEHATHAFSELPGLTDLPDQAAAPATLLPLLAKKQWNLVTTDATFVHGLYEQKRHFDGIIVLILDSAAAPPVSSQDQGKAIDRLFERYPRLSPQRLYTVTPSRVKIRQLPGAVGRGGRRNQRGSAAGKGGEE